MFHSLFSFLFPPSFFRVLDILSWTDAGPAFIGALPELFLASLNASSLQKFVLTTYDDIVLQLPSSALCFVRILVYASWIFPRSNLLWMTALQLSFLPL